MSLTIENRGWPLGTAFEASWTSVNSVYTSWAVLSFRWSHSSLSSRGPSDAASQASAGWPLNMAVFSCPKMSLAHWSSPHFFFFACFPSLCSNAKLQIRQRSWGEAHYTPVCLPATLMSTLLLLAASPPFISIWICWNIFFKLFERKLPVSCCFTPICFNLLMWEQKLVSSPS